MYANLIWPFCWTYTNLTILFVLFSTTEIETERTHQNIFQGIEGFDKKSMQHAETKEKVALPGKEGNDIIIVSSVRL